jgi:hypothetical protein
VERADEADRTQCRKKSSIAISDRLTVYRVALAVLPVGRADWEAPAVDLVETPAADFVEIPVLRASAALPKSFRNRRSRATNWLM